MTSVIKQGCIYKEGSACNKLYFIKTGEVALSKLIVKAVTKESTVQELFADPSLGRQKVKLEKLHEPIQHVL